MPTTAQGRTARMRVLHLGKFYPPTAGGIERALEALSAESVAAGIDVDVLAHAPSGHRHTRERMDAGVRVIEAGCYGQLVYAPISPAFPWQLARLLRAHKPNVLHLHLPNTSAFFALLSPQARRIPWVVHWHADIPLDSGSRTLRLAYPLYRPWEQAVLRRAAAIIATSPEYRDASQALAPWRNKVTVIPLSLNEITALNRSHNAASAPENAMLWPATGLKLLAVGRLSHYKGFDVLIRALTHTPDVSLLLIGSGEESERLRALISTLGVHHRVRLAGHVDDETLALAYAQADAFCLPSLDRAEAFGLVLLEAMRASLPIVASAIAGSGVGHVLRDSALMTPPGDVDALAGALRTLAHDASLRTRLATAGHARWRDHFTPAQTTPALLALYRQVLGR